MLAWTLLQTAAPLVSTAVFRAANKSGDIRMGLDDSVQCGPTNVPVSWPEAPVLFAKERQNRKKLYIKARKRRMVDVLE